MLFREEIPGAVPSHTESDLSQTAIDESKLALVNHFKRVAIWIKHVRGVIAGIIFQTNTRRDIVLCAGSNCSLVEGVYRFIVFCAEAPVD